MIDRLPGDKASRALDVTSVVLDVAGSYAVVLHGRELPRTDETGLTGLWIVCGWVFMVGFVIALLLTVEGLRAGREVARVLGRMMFVGTAGLMVAVVAG